MQKMLRFQFLETLVCLLAVETIDFLEKKSLFLIEFAKFFGKKHRSV